MQKIRAWRKIRSLAEKDAAKIPQKLRRGILTSVLPQIASTLIARGDFDPDGKSDADLDKAMVVALRQFMRGSRIEFILTSDHRQALLSRARISARTKDNELAILFYATYFEHQINGIISELCARRNPPIQPLPILREANMRAKCTWVLDTGLRPVGGAMGEPHRKHL